MSDGSENVVVQGEFPPLAAPDGWYWVRVLDLGGMGPGWVLMDESGENSIGISVASLKKYPTSAGEYVRAEMEAKFGVQC